MKRGMLLASASSWSSPPRRPLPRSSTATATGNSVSASGQISTADAVCPSGLQAVGGYFAPSFAAASRMFLTVASGALRPSSFSPWRFTQITGTFSFSAGPTSAS
jgi:hypothetical protein